MKKNLKESGKLMNRKGSLQRPNALKGIENNQTDKNLIKPKKNSTFKKNYLVNLKISKNK